MNLFKNLEQSFRKLNHRRIHLFRQLRTRLLLFFFNKKNKEAQATSRPQSAVFLRLDGKLGDTITFSALVHQMINSCPDIKIYILTRKISLEVYQCLFPQLIESGQIRLYFVEKRIIKIFKTLFDLRPFVFDVMVSTSHILDPQSIILARFIRAKNKISFLNQNMIFFDQHILENFFSIHITERYRKVVESMGLAWARPVEYSFTVPTEQIKRISDKLDKIKKEKSAQKMIVLNSFAGARLRNLSYETTLTLIKSLYSEIPDALVVSIANSGDLQILKSWRKQAEQAREFQPFIKNWILMEETSLLSSAATMVLSDLVITPDTSIVHLASALKKPLIALFRPDLGGDEQNSKIWSPLCDQFEVIFSEENDLLGVNAIDIGLVVRTANKFISLT